MKKPELIEIIKNTIKNTKECFEFYNVDGCRVKCPNCQLKIRFDGCANSYFGVKGGCDCIIIFKDKISLVECKNGKFGSSDAKNSIEQIKKCCNFVKNNGNDRFIEAVIYHGGGVEYMSMSRVKIELERLHLSVEFYKCGHGLK
ncbi:MAG: hypothetical protein OIN66_11530 [Candidatus Methanoperedens sp.]|nr:hypothetical protein [Candidatus Methanoperedens sp.]